MKHTKTYWMLMAGLVLASCDPVIEEGASGWDTPAELEILTTPVTVDGKNSNLITVSNQSAINCQWIAPQLVEDSTLNTFTEGEIYVTQLGDIPITFRGFNGTDMVTEELTVHVDTITYLTDALSERLCIGTEGAPDHFGTGFDPDAIVIEQSICSNGKKDNSLTITANTNPVLCTFNWGTGSMDTNVGKLTYYGLGEDIELTVDILAADGSAHTYSLGTYTAEDYSDLPEAITQITGWHPEDSPTGTKTWQLSVDEDQWSNGQYGSLSTWWTTTVESQGGSTGTMTFDYAAGTLTKVIDDETNERGDCSGSGTFSLDFSTATDDIVCTLETGGESNIVFPYLINEDYAETRTFQVVSLTDNELWLCAQHIDPSASADEGTFWHFQAVTEE